jgi:RNase P protein component
MITKKFRLTERETRKVLQKWKPFFCWEIVLNKLQNHYNYNRFAIVISSKSISSAVERNFFRRRFYDFCYDKILIDTDKDKTYNIHNSNFKQLLWNDLVFVIKQKTKLNMEDKQCLEDLKRNLDFLMKKGNVE